MSELERIEDALEFDTTDVRERIVDFIRENVEDAGADGVVLGLSGGLDSSTATILSAEALGGDNVLAIFMPEERMRGSGNAEDVGRLTSDLGVGLKEIGITPILRTVKEQIDEDSTKIADANLRPRIRMVILYYYANLLDYLVIGATNKSELKAGYFTKYGDGAADLLPLGSLYKTQVRELAGEIGCPREIIEKKPSAGLWRGQTDEEELGLPYEKIDRIYAGFELGFGVDEIAYALEIEESEVEGFLRRREDTAHKLKRPPTPDL